MKGSTKTLRFYTAEDWIQLRSELILGSNSLWEHAVDMIENLMGSKFFSPKNEIMKIGNSLDETIEFSKNVRFEHIHEAFTLGQNVAIIEESEKRDLMAGNVNARKNFIMKMDEIACLEHAWYFIYGSNLEENRIRDRLAQLNDQYLAVERCVLENYEFVYNKRSKDGSAKANIQKQNNRLVEGIAILVLKTTLPRFFEKFEIGYNQKEVSVIINGEDPHRKRTNIKAVTCLSEKLTNAPPKACYVNIILKGAAERSLPQLYIEKYLKCT